MRIFAFDQIQLFMRQWKLWMMAATLVCGTSLFIACSEESTDNPVAPIEPRQRVITFEGIENAREMGGLVMQDGRTVRFGRLIRSANLSTATDADVDVLTDLFDLSDVFDFRFEAEAAAAPDRIIDGVTYTHLSTMPKLFVGAFSSSAGDSSGSEQVDTRDLAAITLKHAFNPNVQILMRLLYPAIVTDLESQAYYGEFLRGVLNAQGGVLWHCSQGKDRAGWAAAFLLAALGAEREVIVDDFDLSNQSYASKVEALLALVPADKEGSDEAAAFIRAMIGVSRENFESTLDMIDSEYGSLSQYIENQLGFTKEEQQLLRDKYLAN